MPKEYANQDVELVVIIQTQKKISSTENANAKKAELTQGQKVLDILESTAYLASLPDIENLSENYKEYLDWSDKLYFKYR